MHDKNLNASKFYQDLYIRKLVISIRKTDMLVELQGNELHAMKHINDKEAAHRAQKLCAWKF